MAAAGLLLCLLTNIYDSYAATSGNQIDMGTTAVFEDDEMSSKINSALGAIHDAEDSGADVSTLVDQFNIAIDQLRSAEGPDYGSCGSYEHCVDNANQIFASIVNDAKELGQNAEMKHYENVLKMLIYAVIIAFALSSLGVYLYGRYRSSELRRFLEMEVREN